MTFKKMDLSDDLYKNGPQRWPILKWNSVKAYKNGTQRWPTKMEVSDCLQKWRSTMAELYSLFIYFKNFNYMPM